MDQLGGGDESSDSWPHSPTDDGNCSVLLLLLLLLLLYKGGET